MTASALGAALPAVVSSDTWAEPGRSTVVWLSDQEIAFLGAGAGIPGHRSIISIWDLTRGVRTYREHVRFLCAANGTLAYTLDDAAKSAFYGTPGHETPIESRRVSHVTCQLRSEDANHDRDIVPLLPEHGWLDRGPLRGMAYMDNSAILLWKKGSSQGIGIGLKHWDTAGVGWYPFKGAYLIDSQYYDPQRRVTLSPWPPGQPRPQWWMTPDGKLTRFTVVAPWNQAPAYVATRVGLVVSMTDPFRSHPKFPRDAGLFLIKPDGSADTLSTGQIVDVAASPDGCHIAFVHFETPLRGDSARLKAMRLCP